MANMSDVRPVTVTIDEVKELIRQIVLYATGDKINYNNSNIRIKGVLHAIALALSMSKYHNRSVIVTVLDDTWSGIAVYANMLNMKADVHVCSLQLGIPYECDSESVLGFWPDNVTSISIVPVW